MDIKITIEAPELVCAILALSEALQGRIENADKIKQSITLPTTEQKKPLKPKTEKATSESVKEDASPEDDAVEIPSVVDLRAKAQEKGKTAEGKQSIKALLDNFGSKSISEVPEDKRIAFMKALEEL